MAFDIGQMTRAGIEQGILVRTLPDERPHLGRVFKVEVAFSFIQAFSSTLGCKCIYVFATFQNFTSHETLSKKKNLWLSLCGHLIKRWSLRILPPEFVLSVAHLWFPWLFRGLAKRQGGLGATETLFPAIFATISCNICLVSCAKQMATRIGVFGGGRKEMLSWLNEGRFTQYNDGWTHGFTADVYLKKPGKYCFRRTEGFICRYTYPLQPLVPHMRAPAICCITFILFLSKNVEKCTTAISLTLAVFVCCLRKRNTNILVHFNTQHLKLNYVFLYISWCWPSYCLIIFVLYNQINKWN